ncbi:MAG: hypothetical protein K6G30_03265, partial [Acetatifactor sp.]|nr:hypothetical protein [Acetatifactor sp.]
FWNEQRGVFEQHLPANPEDKFVYWWHAHVIDALLDGYIRTNDERYMERIRAELAGTYRENGNTFLNNWYDDMEWMALAQLRLYDVTKEKQYLDNVLTIWEDIKTAWNDFQSGGLAWKKDQLDYKNTPANAPAAILAYRLFQRLGREEDLAWGNRIFEWNRDHLMDVGQGIVYDGINRLGDGKIDYEWDFTYCQGVMAGAALERYKIGKKQEDLTLAFRIAAAAKKRLCDAFGGVIPYEGKDDCGLFKGIMIRYFTELVLFTQDAKDIKEMILENARVICEKGMDTRGIIGAKLDQQPAGVVDLAQHLSGMMILEMAAGMN